MFLRKRAGVKARRNLHRLSRWAGRQPPANSAGTSPAQAARLQRQATAELRTALPLAAAANSDDGSWNSLMTTISEVATVDESHLVPSLRAQCVVADTNQNVNPQGPSGSQPPNTANVNPQSPGG